MTELELREKLKAIITEYLIWRGLPIQHTASYKRMLDSLEALITSHTNKARIDEINRANRQTFSEETVWEYLRNRLAELRANNKKGDV